MATPPQPHRRIFLICAPKVREGELELLLHVQGRCAAVEGFGIVEVDEERFLAVVYDFGPSLELDEAHGEIEMARQSELLACLGVTGVNCTEMRRNARGIAVREGRGGSAGIAPWSVQG